MKLKFFSPNSLDAVVIIVISLPTQNSSRVVPLYRTVKMASTCSKRKSLAVDDKIDVLLAVEKERRKQMSRLALLCLQTQSTWIKNKDKIFST